MKGFIYIIKNTITNQCYVGVTHSHKKRKQQHFKALRENTHYNLKLQRSYNKYKESFFLFEIVRECEIDELYSLEIEYIDKCNSYSNGFNLTKGGRGGDVRKVNQFCKEGRLIKEWDSISQAADYLNIQHTHIWKCCNLRQQTAGGFQWRYKEDFENKLKQGCKRRGDIKYIFQYSIEGAFIKQFNNAVEAAQTIETHNNKNVRSIAINIRKVCQLTSFIAYGYQWRYFKANQIEPIDLKERKKQQTKGLNQAKR